MHTFPSVDVTDKCTAENVICKVALSEIAYRRDSSHPAIQRGE